MSKEYNFYPFNKETDRHDQPVEKYIYKNRCVFKNNLMPTQGLAPKIKDLIPENLSKLIPQGFFCGYVAIAKKDLPRDWWGNYEAVGLQQLAIHGGITFCEIEGATDQEKYWKEYTDKMEQLVKDQEKDNEDLKERLGDIIDRTLQGGKIPPTEADLLKKIDHTMKRIKDRIKLKEELRDNLCKTDEGYVIFGFDCGHAHDEENPYLKDPNHVMMLVEQMENQLMVFKDYYEEYKEAVDTPVTRGIVRRKIMTEVHNKADIKTGVSMSHMIDLLSGKVDPEDTIEEI